MINRTRGNNYHEYKGYFTPWELPCSFLLVLFRADDWNLSGRLGWLYVPFPRQAIEGILALAHHKVVFESFFHETGTLVT
jgi:hypothetical protein